MSSPASWAVDRGYNFDCDVPAGRASSWDGPVGFASEVEVEGTIQILQTREHDRWRPVASVFLHDEDASHRAGIQLFISRGEPDKVQIALYADERRTFAALPLAKLESATEFELSLSRSGDLTASVSGEAGTMRLDGFQVRRLTLSCSSGQFKFEDVAVSVQNAPQVADNAPVDCVIKTTASELLGLIEEKSPEAMKSWPEARARYLRGLTYGHSLFVTFVLVDQNQTAEYVFLAVDDISDEGVSGRIWNELSAVEGFQFGDRFLVDEDAISDWLITNPDGTEEGNLVGKYLDAHQQCANPENAN